MGRKGSLQDRIDQAAGQDRSGNLDLVQSIETKNAVMKECHELLTEAGVAGADGAGSLQDRIHWALKDRVGPTVPDREVAMAMAELDKAGAPKDKLDERVAWLRRRLEDAAAPPATTVGQVMDRFSSRARGLATHEGDRLSNLEKRVAWLERRRCEELDAREEAPRVCDECVGGMKDLGSGVVVSCPNCGRTPDGDEAAPEDEDYDHSDDRSVAVLKIAERAVKSGRCSRILVNGSWRLVKSKEDVDTFRVWVKNGARVSEYRSMENEDRSLKVLDLARSVLESMPKARAQIRIAPISGGDGYWENVLSSAGVKKIQDRIRAGSRISEYRFDG